MLDQDSGLLGNVWNNIPVELFSEEIVTPLWEDDRVRIERILSCGQVSPEGFWYDQQEDEWVMLLQGEAVLKYEHGTDYLSPGDYRLIPKHKKHRVEMTSKNPICIWVCVFLKEGKNNGK